MLDSARTFAYRGIEIFSTHVRGTHLLANCFETIFPKNIGIELLEQVVLIRRIVSTVTAPVLSELIDFVAIAGL